MTRRPIFIGIATILALAIAAGLAYAAGRVVSTRSYADQVGLQGPQVVARAPGFYGQKSDAHFGGQGTAFRDQMRQWMRDRFASWRHRATFAGDRWTTATPNHTRTGSANRGTSYRGSGYQHHSGYHHRHMRSGSWGGGGGCCGW